MLGGQRQHFFLLLRLQRPQYAYLIRPARVDYQSIAMAEDPYMQEVQALENALTDAFRQEGNRRGIPLVVHALIQKEVTKVAHLVCIKDSVLAGLAETQSDADMRVLDVWVRGQQEAASRLAKQRARGGGGGGNPAGGSATGALRPTSGKGSAGVDFRLDGKGGRQAKDKYLWGHKETTPEHIFQMLRFFDVAQHVSSVSALVHGAKAEQMHDIWKFKFPRYARFARQHCFPALQISWRPKGEDGKPAGTQYPGKSGKSMAVWALVHAWQKEKGIVVEGEHVYPPEWVDGEAPSTLLAHDNEPAVIWWKVRAVRLHTRRCPFPIVAHFFS